MRSSTGQRFHEALSLRHEIPLPDCPIQLIRQILYNIGLHIMWTILRTNRNKTNITSYITSTTMHCYIVVEGMKDRKKQWMNERMMNGNDLMNEEMVNVNI